MFCENAFKMSEMAQQFECGAVLVQEGLVWPLSPSAHVSDLDLGQLARITEEMSNTGYKVVRDFTNFSGEDSTIMDAVLDHLFSGGEERSLKAYERFLENRGQVIGPYVKAFEGQPLRFGLGIWDDLRFGMRRRVGDVSWGIIGAGTIGSRVIEQIAEQGIAERSGLSVVPDFVLRKAGLSIDGQAPRQFGANEKLPDVDMLFVATPGIAGSDSPAYRHIISQLKRRGLVVTAEKASVAEHFEEFRTISDNFGRLGINATVGGGTRLLDIAGGYAVDRKNVTEAHFELNGTLSFIMGQVANGEAVGVAVDQAVALGYAEPGASEVQDVMAGEATSDVPRKLAVLLNKLFLVNPVNAEEFTYQLDAREVRQALREAADRRFVVSVYNAERLSSAEELERSVLGGFATRIEGWVVIGGFQRVRENPLTKDFADHVGAVAGASIGLGPQNQDGVYKFHGPGAGPKPTANTMLDDAQVLIERQRERRSR